jgi:hypothetical protein
VTQEVVVQPAEQVRMLTQSLLAPHAENSLQQFCAMHWSQALPVALHVAASGVVDTPASVAAGV